ncbi:PLP-dependent aminotransferase family protein [Caenispirillum bisanense]|uniref:aminotransferase-like domain-containing protein n=1 Tax=Caenispirillum bisanense TaxID=414052 RepID=UPI0031DFFB67
MEALVYEAVAGRLAAAIDDGTYAPGDRLPSVRALARREGVSPMTALRALELLADRGLSEARPRSGHFVTLRGHPAVLRQATATAAQATLVSIAGLAAEILGTSRDRRLLPLGDGVPGADLPPLAALARAHGRVLRQQGATAFTAYGDPRGEPALRKAIARIMAEEAAAAVSPEDIVVTNGCAEALDLALTVTTRPGDVVAIESPSYFGTLQALEAQGLKALPIATDPRRGLDLDALAAALAAGGVAAVVVMPAVHNPLGCAMDAAARARLLDLCRRAAVPLIEDDTFGPLSFATPRPPAVKAADLAGDVLYCGAFSKTVAPALRLGWIAAGRWPEAVARQKMLRTLASPTPAQLALAEVVADGRHARIARRAARTYRRRLALAAEAVARHFPPGTEVSQPAGGFMLWVRLPPGGDGLALYRAARAAGIGVAPGSLFAPGGEGARCLRISVGVLDGAALRDAVARLGALARQSGNTG